MSNQLTRCQYFISKNHVAILIQTKLKLGICDNDTSRCSVIPRLFAKLVSRLDVKETYLDVQFQGGVLHFLGMFFSNHASHLQWLVKINETNLCLGEYSRLYCVSLFPTQHTMVTNFSFCAGRKQGLRQLITLS